MSVSYKDDLWNLLEFLEYHLIIGVSHFFIFNNDVDPSFSSRVLQPYVDEGIVTNIIARDHLSRYIIPFRHNRQIQGHQACLNLAKSAGVKWLALLDMDEFLYPLKADSMVDLLEERYAKHRAVLFRYRCFGSSGLETRPNLQTESFVGRAIDDFGPNHMCKAVGQVKYFHTIEHHHYFEQFNGVNDLGKPAFWVHPLPPQFACVNHYIVRSKQDFDLKMKRGNPLGDRRTWDWFDRHNRNEVYDNGIHRFLGKLKESLAKRADLLKLSRRQITL